ncbi:DEAD/DEAH box helicase family protein [Trichomonas vaginalis G3]|uniref:ATP-dependent RNA helicase n=1 Tax=Trichomonas vaginalis (strain ATCC PRA-98 / G3) TaxID=412133 RepID=A2E5C2_TRIV3|nr:helicase protein [Trichomonas vaginalis G3]EAY12202.1 DEAD/DEAH box helicase family protein [Trichomonas vaginalis G3]KAI5515398.1 helicase protein [Trichomonas vaginalis G3]|eukprot:XP_001324425.1 DEAD/DEAH box helicase family protein [Trichomonas vaginalis G3]
MTEEAQQNPEQTEQKTEQTVTVEEITEGLFSESTIDAFELNPRLISALKKMKIDKFTNIQTESIPPIISGSDVLMRADTGSGKTLAYLLPIMHRLATDFPRDTNPIRRDMGCLAIVIAPTRELCLQIETVVQDLRSQMNFVISGSLLGGEKVQSEKKRLRKGINLLIATPGRLLYHLQNSQNLYVNNLKFLVLDEADRLLDMGFGKKVAEIIEIINQAQNKVDDNPVHQTILVSATLPKELHSLTEIALYKPTEVGIMQDEKFSIPQTLLQRFVTVDAKWRLVALATLLKRYMIEEPETKAIVFLSCCKSVDFHASFFSFFNFMTPEERAQKKIPQRNYKGPNPNAEENKPTIRDTHASTDNDEVGAFSQFFNCPVFRIHGNVDQIERSKTISKFTAAKSAIMFCTDVAARGLDIPNISVIIQYDPPVDTEDYVHRVGRTARIGHDGISYLFLQQNELGFIDLLRDRKVQIKPYKYEELQRKGVAAMLGDNPNLCFAAMRKETFECVKTNDLEMAAGQAWAASIAAYTSHHKTTRSIFRAQALHLGHLATAFGLEKTPAEIKEMLHEDRDLQESINKPTEKKEMLPAFEERTSEFL